MKNLTYILIACAAASLCSCKGRTAENMEPLGETVEVVIPDGDVAADAEIANGEADLSPIADSTRTRAEAETQASPEPLSPNI